MPVINATNSTAAAKIIPPNEGHTWLRNSEYQGAFANWNRAVTTPDAEELFNEFVGDRLHGIGHFTFMEVPIRAAEQVKKLLTPYSRTLIKAWLIKREAKNGGS